MSAPAPHLSEGKCVLPGSPIYPVGLTDTAHTGSCPDKEPFIGYLIFLS